MGAKRISTFLLATALVVPLAQPVLADDLGAAVAGGIIGFIAGNAAAKSKQRTYVRTYDSGVSAATVADNRDVQTALNYFGFPVGAPDGVLGGQSRAGISNMQAFLGYPATGQLTEYQHSLLLTAYNRAIAGGPQTMQQAAANPMGMRGVLREYRDEMAGVSQPAPQPYAAPAPAPAQVTAPTPTVTEAAAAPAPAPAAPAQSTSALPNFLSGSLVEASLASQCNKVSLQTTTNGGFVTVASMTDPNQALAEQFCLARTYAMTQGEELMSKVQGFTTDQITQQCNGFGPALKDYVSELAVKPRDEVLQDMARFISKAGMPPAQLDVTAKICLSVGYRKDSMDVALGSALLLAGLGDRPYAELVGDHLSQGFGTTARPDLALDWYKMALDALAQGTPAVFAPGQPERTTLIRKAAFAAAGQPDLPAPQAASLPSFAAPSPAPAGGTAQPKANP